RVFFFSSRRRHTRSKRDWSSDVCSSDLIMYFELKTLDVAGAAREKCDALVLLVGESFKAGKDPLGQLAGEALKAGHFEPKAGKRSEERRVGKECSAGWGAASWRNKDETS